MQPSEIRAGRDTLVSLIAAAVLALLIWAAGAPSWFAGSMGLVLFTLYRIEGKLREARDV
jgi:Ca2+/H+ antiporter